MAAAEIAIRIVADAARAQQAIGTTSSRMDKFASVAAKGAKIAAAGFLAVGAGAVKLAQGAAEDEAAASKLAQTLTTTTGATKSQVAAVEDWITKQGQLTGITDDELRPAIAKLATATGSVTKAQRLALLAQDIAVGSGKSYQSVVQALAKAQTGSVSALSRFGVATKDAAGETKSLTQVQADLARKFKGQAATAASTTAGQFKIFQTQLAEAGETIGYAVLPVLTKLAQFLVSKVIPAITHLFGFVQEHQTTFKVLAIAVAGVGAAFIAASAVLSIYSGAMKVHAVVTKAISAATKVWTGVQWALNAAMSANPLALVAIAIGVVIAAVVLFATKTETGRKIVTAAWSAIKAAVDVVVTFFTDDVPAAFNAVLGVAKDLIGWVRSNWKKIGILLTGPIGIAVALVVKHWDKIKAVFTKGIAAVVRFFSNLPGKVGNAVRSLTSTIRTAFSTAMTAGLDKVKAIAGTILTWLTGIPGKATNALRGLLGAIRDAFSTAMTAGKDKVTSIAATIVNAVAAIPGKMLALGSKFGDAGRKVLQAFVDGMKNAAGIIEGIAGNVWNAVKGLLNGAIAKINAALEFTIGIPGPDIHFNLPDIPPLMDTGGIVRGPGIVRVGPIDEAMIPLTGPHARKGTGAGVGPITVEVHLDGQMIGRFTQRQVDAAVSRQARRIVLRGVGA